MKTILQFVLIGLTTVSACNAQEQGVSDTNVESTVEIYSVKEEKVIKVSKIVKTDEEWQKELTPEEFRIARMKGTERAFTGEYNDNHDEGTYLCRCCETELYTSNTKYESGSGWPSFYDVVAKENVDLIEDRSAFETRVEVTCARCGAHLGHVFTDGPQPTGLRYCMNSASLKFQKKE